MIPQISKALSSGYTSKQIISFMLKKFPEHSDKINSALTAGFSADQVLKLLSGGKKALAMPEDNQNESMTEFQQNRSRDIARGESLNKKTLQTAALAATPLASQAVGSALARSLPPILSKLAPGVPNSIAASLTGQNIQDQAPQSPQTTMPPNIIPSQQPPISNQVAPNIAQPQQVTQSEGIINPLDKSREEADALWQRIQKGVTNHPDKDINAFLKVASNLEKYQGLKREDFDNLYQQFIEKKSAGIPVADIAKEMFSTYKQEHPEPEIDQHLNEEKPTIEKGSSVSSPQGIGEIKELRNGQALIDIDGKLHKVKEEDLEPPLFSNDEVADAYDNLMAKIPEEHKSGFISWAGYDEDRNVLGFIPRGGKYEELKDITPEEANIIKEGKGVARTNGETREGLWVMGEDTRGGLISQIIHDRRKANKASEEKQLKLGFEIPKPEKEDRGMKPLFDEMAHAREKSRERERKKKEEEKARKKKEKDEAKKRKK